MRRGKYERRPPTVFNLAICLALVLFWLVAVTTHVSVDLFARYLTEGTGNDGARIMTFGPLTISEESDGSFDAEKQAYHFIFTPGVDLKKDIKVSFDGSEADTFVFVELETTGWEKNGGNTFRLGNNLLLWSVDEAWTYLQSQDDRHVYYMILDANNNKLTNQPVIKDGKIQVSKATRGDYKDLEGDTINISAAAYVVQAGGFYHSEDMKENAAKAWESIKP